MIPGPHDFEPEPEDFNPDPDTLCPNCLTDWVDPASFYGFCPKCTASRPKVQQVSRQERWAPNGWRHANGERIPEVDFTNARLPRLERVIQAGLRSFVAVGSALKAIKERRLYRESGYRSFEAYCRERWGFSDERARQQISAAALVDELASDENPTQVGFLHERHIRELARLPVAEARDVWAGLIAIYPPNLITGNAVKAEVDRLLGELPEQVTKETLCPSCGTWHPLAETRTTRTTTQGAEATG